MPLALGGDLTMMSPGGTLWTSNRWPEIMVVLWGDWGCVAQPLEGHGLDLCPPGRHSPGSWVVKVNFKVSILMDG